MDKLVIERRSGGVNPLKGRGEVDAASLDADARAALDALFSRKKAAAPLGNSPVYRITRQTSAGERSIDIPEHLMPQGLVGAVKDELP